MATARSRGTAGAPAASDDVVDDATPRPLAMALVIAAMVVLAVLDVALGDDVALAGLLVGAPLLVWTARGPGVTAVAGVLAMALAVALGVVNDMLAEPQHLVRLVALGAASVVAVHLARRRVRREQQLAALVGERRRADEAMARIMQLQEIGEAGLHHLELGGLLAEVAGKVREALRADCATVLLPEDDDLVVRASVGLLEGGLGARVPVGAGVAGGVAADVRPRRVDDLAEVEVHRSLLVERGVVSLLAVPLPVGDRVGVLHVGAAERARFDDDDLERLERVARRVALAVDRVELLGALRDSEEVARAVVDSSVDAVVSIEPTGRILRVNPATERLFGYEAAELVGRDVTVLMPEPHRSQHASYLEHYHRTGERRIIGSHRAVEGRRRDGTTFPVDLAVVETHVQGQVVYVGTLRDISEAKEAERQLAHAAFHDPLTGLANRRLLLDRLQHAMTRRGLRAGAIAVLILDLDRFKRVNDSLGHDAGDDLLVAVAARLVGAVRPADTVARLGGDEFVVMCEDLDGPAAAAAVAERLLDALAHPVALGEGEVFVSSSIGIAAAADGMSSDDLLRNADAAMYRAKERGRGRFEMYDEDMQARALARLRMESQLHRALERDEFELHYQPQVDLRTGDLGGVEALVRWRHRERGLLAPAEFLDVAEESGLILEIGRWVLEEACRTAVRWGQQVAQPPAVWVNLSARQLAHPSLPATVEAALQAAGLEPGNLVLEVTEGALLEDPATTARRLQALRESGVRVAIDDFGTGYSSLAYLRTFPLDALKLDRSFVAGLSDHEASPIVAAVAGLATGLGITAVAEGVEDEEQLAALRRLGYDTGQGFLFARPSPELDLGRRGVPTPASSDGRVGDAR